MKFCLIIATLISFEIITLSANLRTRDNFRKIMHHKDKLHQDGVAILEKDDVKLTDGAWTTIVTARRPVLVGLEQWAENITNTLEDKAKNWPIGLLTSWTMRIQYIRDRVTLNEARVTQQETRSRRTKRSPFGFVGSLSHYLFGIAEDSSINILKNHVEQARQQQEQLLY